MTEFYTPIECPCGREVFFTEDPFHPYPTGETHIAYCDCGRIWKLQETSGEKSFPEMDEEEELAYSLQTEGGRDSRT